MKLRCELYCTSLATAVIGAWILPAICRSDDFPQPYNSEADKAAEPMPAAEAARSFAVPDGFRVTVFASEPDVQNPIAMTWDARGRLWIAENYTYAERRKRFDLSLRDRVLIFEDLDGDGASDKRTVFTDQVQQLTSVAVGHGGVWLMCPPRLLFVPDADGDDIADGPVRVALDGFDVPRDNYHNFANGLKWGPDGWLYGRCGGSCPGKIGAPGTPDDQRVALEGGIWRYNPHSSRFEVLSHGTTNPWGHDWNEFGELFFINTVNGHLWHGIPGAHFKRPFTLDPNPYVYELIDMHADHWHFDTGQGWTKSRDGAADSLGGGHAHTGMMIYQGDNWPAEYRGRLLTWNIHGRRANQEILKRSDSGYVGRHGDDMLIATDPFFRGIDLSCGPDGAVYAIDWSDTGECHEHTGVHRTSGRIYRIAYGNGSGTDRPFDLRQEASVHLTALMNHSNEWHVRQARLILAERSRGTRSAPAADDLPQAIGLLRRAVRGTDALAAHRALTTLHAMRATDEQLLRECLVHRNEHIRARAIHLLADDWPIDDIFGPVFQSSEDAAQNEKQADRLMGDLCQLARTDGSGLVRLTLASTLQRLPVALRPKLAAALLQREEDADDHNLPLLVWYGLMPVADADPMSLAEMAIVARWPKTQRLIARRLAEQIAERAEPCERLLEAVVDAEDPELRRNLLAGISDGLRGWHRAPMPSNWSAVVDSTTSQSDPTTLAIVRDLSALFGDGRALEEVRAIVLDRNADIGLRRSALKTLVARADSDVSDICQPLLGDARLNVIAAHGMARSSDPRAAEELVKHYYRFRAPRRPGVIEILVARASFAHVLLDAVEAGRLPASDLSAFDVRQVRSHSDPALQRRVTVLWGEVRDSSAEAQERIESLKAMLAESTLRQADLPRGRQLFKKNCASCHRLYGQGEAIGPDLTGANRDNLDYLLDNIVDPSAVLSKDYRMTIVYTVDGRVLNGLVLAKTDKTLRLHTQTETKTIALADIDELETTRKSPMPDQLLDELADEDIANLIAYLMHPTQVALPEEDSYETRPPPTR